MSERTRADVLAGIVIDLLRESYKQIPLALYGLKFSDDPRDNQINIGQVEEQVRSDSQLVFFRSCDQGGWGHEAHIVHKEIYVGVPVSSHLSKYDDKHRAMAVNPRELDRVQSKSDELVLKLASVGITDITLGKKVSEELGLYTIS